MKGLLQRFGGFILGVLVGIIIAYVASPWVTTAPAGDAPSADDTTLAEHTTAASASTTATTSPETIHVNDQLHGNSVYVAYVPMRGEQTVWVVIHEIKDGVMSNALGAKLLDGARGKSDIMVPLLRGTVYGGEYAVVLYADTNADRRFTLGVDTPLRTDDEREYVMTKFRTN